MKTDKEIIEELKDNALKLGAFGANVILVSDVVTDPAFREACARNACGMYGKCWTCPPDSGDIDELIKKLRGRRYMLLYQTVGRLEDSFDFESMRDCKIKHNELTFALRVAAEGLKLKNTLFLGAGGCGVCEVCAKRTNEPCRKPGLAISSLEAYGVYVSKTAEKAGLKYINGKDTVTYFGAVVFDL